MKTDEEKEVKTKEEKKWKTKEMRPGQKNH